MKPTFFNKNSRKTLVFMRDKEVKYANVLSNRKPITMIVRLTGNNRATICSSMVSF